MKITFTSHTAKFQSSEIELQTLDNYLLISVTRRDEGFESTETHHLSRNELKDFIGALLHIQSKMKGGSNG